MAHAEHVETHFMATNFVRDVVIGMADGLTVPFALAAGLSGAQMEFANVVKLVHVGIAFAVGGTDQHERALRRRWTSISMVTCPCSGSAGCPAASRTEPGGP